MKHSSVILLCSALIGLGLTACHQPQPTPREALLQRMHNLQQKYYDRFRKTLSARQTARVMQFNDPFAQKHCCGKHEGKKCGHHDGVRPAGGDPRQAGCDHRHPHPAKPEPAAAPASEPASSEATK